MKTFNNIRPTCWIIEHTKKLVQMEGTAIKRKLETLLNLII